MGNRPRGRGYSVRTRSQAVSLPELESLSLSLLQRFAAGPSLFFTEELIGDLNLSLSKRSLSVAAQQSVCVLETELDDDRTSCEGCQ